MERFQHHHRSQHLYTKSLVTKYNQPKIIDHNISIRSR